MPKATRVAPPRNGPVAAYKAPEGSVLAESIPVGDVRDLYIKMVLYGDNGTGKTHLACQFPKPLLLISFEPGEASSGGARTVKRVPGVKLLQIRPTLLEEQDDKVTVIESGSAKFIRLAEEFRKGNNLCDLPDPRYHRKPYQTVVVDSVTSMQEMLLAELLGLEQVPVQLNFGSVPKKVYQDRAEQSKVCLRPWLNLPVHTIFVGKETDHSREQERDEGTGKVKPDLTARWVRGIRQESRIAVQLGGAAAGWLNDGCDYICRLYHDKEMIDVVGTQVPTGKLVRCLRIGAHNIFASRFRADSWENLPDEIIEPTYEKIIAAIEGRNPNLVG